MPYGGGNSMAANTLAVAGGGASASDALAVMSVRNALQTFKSHAEEQARQGLIWHEAQMATKKELEDAKVRLLQAEHQLTRAAHDKSSLEARLAHADEDLATAQQEAARLTHERATMLANADDAAQRVRGFIRDVDGMVTTAVSRSHTAAGQCGCPPSRLSSTIGKNNSKII